MTKHDKSGEWVGVDRRSFLKGLGLVMACPLLNACEFVDVFDEGGGAEDVFFDLSTTEFSALNDVGGTACAQAGSVDVMLIRKNENEVLAVDRFCPHQQLDMSSCGQRESEWDAQAEELTCRWHNSRFSADGEVVNWPSDGTEERRLRVYPVEFDSATGEGRVFATGAPAEDGES